MILYLHGFASGPASTKARYFVERAAKAGVTIHAPSLDEGEFRNLTVTRMLALVERLLGEDDGPHVLIGSSLGGYLAALYASRKPVEALVLMAPAIDYARRITIAAGAAHERWKRDGVIEVDHYALARKMPISYGLIDDAGNHDPSPTVTAPSIVFQGLKDPVVPPEIVADWTRVQPRATWVPLDSGHELTDVMDVIFDRSVRFLAELPAVAETWRPLVRAGP